MAKKTLSSKEQKAQLNKLFATYNKRLGRLYADYIRKLSALYDFSDKESLPSDPLFHFDDYPELKKRLNDIFADYYQNSILNYKVGITDGVALAYAHDAAALTGFSVLSNKALRAARETAAETFISRRLNSTKGLNLAQTVWNYCQQTKSEFEMAMANVLADGLKAGTSAETIGRKIRQYLNNPDMMYRRYHTIKVLKNGTKEDVVTWRRKRIIDGKVRFVEEPLEQVGAGVYRSSRMNALRVARTEINAAYHKARNERWKNEPFVIGQWIHVSPEHKIDDICNELEDRYPKDFDWSGWHSQCLCTSDPIMIQGEEKDEFYRRLYAGEDMSNFHSVFEVKDMPDKYKQYIQNNADKIVKAAKKDKLAWHLADNKKYWVNLLTDEQRAKAGISLKGEPKIKTPFDIAKERHNARTPEQIEKIKRDWQLHRGMYYLQIYQEEMKKPGFADLSSLNQRWQGVLNSIKNEESAKVVKVALNRWKHGIDINLQWIERAKRLEKDGVVATIASTVPDWRLVKDSTKLSYAERLKNILDNVEHYYGQNNKALADSIKGFRILYDDDITLDTLKLWKGYINEMKSGDTMYVYRCIEHLHELRTVGSGVIYKEWIPYYNEAIRAINTHDFVKGGYRKLYTQIEEAYNIFKLSTMPEAKALGLENLSPRMPHNLLTDYTKANPLLKGNLPTKAFWDCFDRFIPLVGGKDGEGYFSPKYFHVWIGRKDSRNISEWYSKNLLHHEFGHSFDYQKGLQSKDEIKEVWNKIKDAIHKDEKKFTDRVTEEIRLFKKENPRPGEDKAFWDKIDKLREAGKVEEERRLLDELNKKIFDYDIKEMDFEERLGALTDVLQAGTKSLKFIQPRGHYATYFKDPSNQLAEFWAHCSENYWGGNDLFKKLLPEYYDTMRELVEKYMVGN